MKTFPSSGDNRVSRGNSGTTDHGRRVVVRDGGLLKFGGKARPGIVALRVHLLDLGLERKRLQDLPALASERRAGQSCVAIRQDTLACTNTELGRASSPSLAWNMIKRNKLTV
jgi:hypothetical protein